MSKGDTKKQSFSFSFWGEEYNYHYLNRDLKHLILTRGKTSSIVLVISSLQIIWGGMYVFRNFNSCKRTKSKYSIQPEGIISSFFSLEAHEKLIL